MAVWYDPDALQPRRLLRYHCVRLALRVVRRFGHHSRWHLRRPTLDVQRRTDRISRNRPIHWRYDRKHSSRSLLRSRHEVDDHQE